MLLLAWRRARKARRRTYLAPPAQSLLDLVGNTPLVLINSLSQSTGCLVYAKCEYANPCGSSKDRVAKNILVKAMANGQVSSGQWVVEGTSGSTGISLTRFCACLGLRCVVVMPNDQAVEKRRLLEKLGATVELVRPASIVNPQHYVNTARARAKQLGGFFVNQFESELNDQVHFDETAPEIWDQVGGRIDAFICSAGTGGLISGVARFLKLKNKSVKVVLADPKGSSLAHAVNDGVCFAPEQRERVARKHRVDSLVEGVGCDRLTANFARALPFIDSAERVEDSLVAKMARFLLHRDGFFVGSSSAMNCVSAFNVAKQLGPGHVVVTVFCSSGEREASKLYDDEYCAKVWGITDFSPLPEWTTST